MKVLGTSKKGKTPRHAKTSQLHDAEKRADIRHDELKDYYVTRRG
jgi:hypothetical protein